MGLEEIFSKRDRRDLLMNVQGEIVHYIEVTSYNDWFSFGVTKLADIGSEVNIPFSKSILEAVSSTNRKICCNKDKMPKFQSDTATLIIMLINA